MTKQGTYTSMIMTRALHRAKQVKAYAPQSLRELGKFAAKMNKHMCGFRNDPLQYRAKVAGEIAKHEKGGKICVNVHGTDCDGASFSRQYEINASTVAFIAFCKNEEAHADGRLFIEIATP